MHPLAYFAFISTDGPKNCKVICICNALIRDDHYTKDLYSHGQELFYKFVSNFTNKLVKQLLSMTVFSKTLEQF